MGGRVLDGGDEGEDGACGDGFLAYEAVGEDAEVLGVFAEVEEEAGGLWEVGGG